MRIIEPSVELLWMTPNAAYNIEMAARTCYKSEASYDPAKTPAFLDRIVNQFHHESVIEHGVASFRVICDRGVSDEHQRHRTAAFSSFSQESTRYVNYTKDKQGGGSIQFIHPLDLTEEQLEFSVRAYSIIEGLYNEAISLGMTPQQARDYLPLGVKTEYVVSANFRSWLNFLELREPKSAHPKMQVVAKLIGSIFRTEVPEIFGKPQSS